MVIERTHVVDTGFRSSLGLLQDRWQDALAPASAERAAELDCFAILVVATWLDERGRPQLRSWLRRGDGEGPIAVSVGAHEHSDVGPLYGASLRHVLLIADPLRRGALLDVLDLNTPGGFRADGQKDMRRIETLMAQRLGVGSADVIALVLVPGETVATAWARAQRDGVVAADNALSPVLSPVLAARASQARALRCEVSVALPFSPRQLADLQQLKTREGITRVTGEPIAADTVRVTPTAQDLQAGFLIGRDPRCAVGSTDNQMSRVHAFVRACGDGLLLCDAGSTNGTFVVEEGVHGTVEIELDRGHRARVVPRDVRLRCGSTLVVIAAPKG